MNNKNVIFLDQALEVFVSLDKQTQKAVIDKLGKIPVLANIEGVFDVVEDEVELINIGGDEEIFASILKREDKIIVADLVRNSSLNIIPSIPSPEILQKYEEIFPGATDRIIRQMEIQGSHRRKMEIQGLKAYNFKVLLQIGAGLISVALILSVSFYLILNSYLTIGALSMVVTVLVHSFFFIYRKGGFFSSNDENR